MFKYVVLGDPRTSASLVPVPDPLSLGCARSYSSYPKRLDAALRIYRFTDVSCGGAGTTNMTQPQSTILGTAAPQFDALTPTLISSLWGSVATTWACSATSSALAPGL